MWWGRSVGRFFNTPLDDDEVSSTLTSESGPGEGDLKVLFQPTLVAGQEDEFEGPWSFAAGTADFADLEGGGELSALRDIAAGTIDQTLTGEVAIADGSDADTAQDRALDRDRLVVLSARFSNPDVPYRHSRDDSDR